MVKHSGSLLPLHIHQNAHHTQDKALVSCHYLPYRSNKYLLKHCSLQQMDPVSSARFYNLLTGERDHPQKRKALKRTTCSFLSMGERGYNLKCVVSVLCAVVDKPILKCIQKCQLSHLRADIQPRPPRKGGRVIRRPSQST